MKRRRFLTIAGIGGLLAGLASFRFISTSFEDAVASIILDELSFLKLDKEGVHRFVSDYTKSTSTKNKLMLKGYSFMGISSTQSQKIHTLINAYLLSTDFFTNKMNETRTIKYRGLFDPYLRPCAHPFTSIYFPET
jgi:hypothetical protein